MLYDLRGFPEEKSLFTVRSALFPMRWKILDTVRILVTRERVSPEWDLIKEVARSRSTHEIDGAFFNYEVHPMRTSDLSRAILGRPRLRRALRFYGVLKSDWLEHQHDKKVQGLKN
jgi:hypothetical protein